MSELRWIALWGVCVGLSAASAGAQGDPADPEADPRAGSAPEATLSLDPRADLLDGSDSWTVQVEPAMWLASPAGRLRMPGATRGDRVRLSMLNLDTAQASVAGELHLRSERWRFFLSGAENSVNRRTTATSSFLIGDVDVVSGDVLDVSFDWVAVEGLVGYSLWSRDFRETSASSDRAIPVSIRVDGLAGLRVDDIGFGVREVGGASSQVDEVFVAPVVGARAEVELLDDFTIDLQVTGGAYSDSDTSVTALDVMVGFHWRPHPNVGAQIGWRQSLLGLNSGSGSQEFDYDGTIAGVQLGVVIRF